MNNYKGLTTFFALIITFLPVISFADGTFYYGNAVINEAPPVRTTGTVITQNSSNTVTVGQTEPATILTTENILGIRLKSKAERDAEKAAAAAAEAKAIEEASLAKNSDGTFAYGYTNGNGATYTSGANYVDARRVSRSNYTASAGSINSNFLPNTFGGWLLALALIAVLVVLVRAIMKKINEKPVHKHAFQ